MRRATSTLLFTVILGALMVAPAFAQDAYPPPEDDDTEVIGNVDETDPDEAAPDEAAPDETEPDEAEVRGVALEDEGGLPATGATIGVLTVIGLAGLVGGGAMVASGRRRVSAD